MLKSVPFALYLALLGLGPVACEKKQSQAELNAEKMKAQQALRRVQAAKFYKELTDKYPESPFAAQATERLRAMGPIATPAK